MTRLKRFALLLILAHLLVVAVHGRAHRQLTIPLTRTQEIFILAAVLLGPLVAALLLISRAPRAGAWLLLLSMAASLAFGAYYHFLAIGSDNVASVSSIGWGRIFQASSVLLVLIEALGMGAGIALLRKPVS
jgi:hypothetical protein